MSSDFETIEYLDDIDVDTKKNKKNKHKKEKKEKKENDESIIASLVDALAKTNFKLLILIFILFVFINSDLFIDKILSRVEGAVDHRAATSKGVVIQGIFLVLAFVIADVLVQSSIL
jgi:hypothetical protein